MLKVRKTLALVLVFIMSVSLLVGCGQANQPVNSATPTPSASASATPEQTEKPKEVVKLTICLSQTGWGGEAVDPELMKEVEAAIEAKTMTDL
ncbi:MAG TPA: hypothetical protein VHT34_05095, partial [Clostridia bacterium]|nr:hypothetical protein [Clostridia bacterium]